MTSDQPFTPGPVKPEISLDDLARIDIRVGTIQAVDDIERTSKLMKLTVSFGSHTRSIVAGIKRERPDPQMLVGRQALFVLNLPPRTMAGVVSEGMLFDLGYADGLTPCLAVPESPVPDGTRAG
jgi:tRNA-binding protein